MRIIAGRARGRSIQPPPGRGTRPTLARVREAMFSALQSRLDFDGLSVLDAFSGSGALGLEAWSRGSHQVVCVEQHRRAFGVLQHNVRALNADTEVQTVCATMPRALGSEPLVSLAPWDLVLVDPPWASDLDVALLGLLVVTRQLNTTAFVLVEHAPQRLVTARLPPIVADAFDTVTGKQYGGAAFTIFRRSDP